MFVTDGPTLACHDDGQLFFPCAALIILELDVSSWLHVMRTDRKSVVEGKSVDLGGRRIIKKKQKKIQNLWVP